MTAETTAILAVCFAAAAFIVQVVEKIFGGGNALANKFHALETQTRTDIAGVTAKFSTDVAAVRNELNSKIDEYEKVATVGFDAIRANIHAMQIGLLEFRSKMSDDLHMYIRKDDYNAGIGDIKRDVQNGFRNVEERMGQLQDLIVYANPDLVVHRPGAQHPKR